MQTPDPTSHQQRGCHGKVWTRQGTHGMLGTSGGSPSSPGCCLSSDVVSPWHDTGRHHQPPKWEIKVDRACVLCNVTKLLKPPLQASSALSRNKLALSSLEGFVRPGPSEEDGWPAKHTTGGKAAHPRSARASRQETWAEGLGQRHGAWRASGQGGLTLVRNTELGAGNVPDFSFYPGGLGKGGGL